MRWPIFIIILIGFVLIANGTGFSERVASISSNNKTEMLQNGVWIGDILNNSTNYDGKLVSIAGTYDGWNAHRKINVPPPVTRSDWVIQDDTGSIYVTGMNPGLDPYEDVGVGLVVSGIVHKTESMPFIDGKNVTLMGGPNSTKARNSKPLTSIYSA